MPPDNWEVVRRLLLICFETVEIADQVSLVLEALHQRLPHAQVTLLVLHPVAQINNSPGPDQDILNEQYAIERGAEYFKKYFISTSVPEDYLRLINLLKDAAFDAAIILNSSSQSPYTLAYLCYLAGIRIRAGSSCEFGGVFYQIVSILQN